MCAACVQQQHDAKLLLLLLLVLCKSVADADVV
jgi:hypothetical protein